MTSRLEMCGVVLSCPPFQVGGSAKWYVDGEPMKDARHAVEIFFARCYPSTQDLPRAFIQYHRRVVGVGLACPSVMVRRERERGGFKSQRALAKASGVSFSTISAIERGDRDPRASTLFSLLHACDSRR